MSEASRPVVVTIDGPAGSGKSTTARAVAERLGVRHLDSGALYRALTYALLEDAAEEDWSELTAERLAAIPLELRPVGGGFEILLEGRRLEREIRTDRVTAAVSPLSELPLVRGRLLPLQRQAARHGPLVSEGRDMGTVVFPAAELKVFLTASLSERARRRYRERRGREPSEKERVAEAERIAARDRRDRERGHAPLRRPRGAIELDTSELRFEDQVRMIVEWARDLTPLHGCG